MATGWADGRTVRRLWARVLAEYGDVCWLCGLPGADTLDHVVPRKRGGTADLANLRPAHRGCNARKGARLVGPTRQPSARSRPW